MSEETQAASSPAELADPFKGEQVSMAEFNKYRQDGELPDRFKADDADPAPADAPEQKAEPESEDSEPEPDSEPEEKQELPPKAKPHEKRIRQLLAETNELKRQLAEKTGVKTESPTAPAPQHAFPKPTPDDKNADGSSKYSSYEDVVEAIGRWAAKEERTKWEREQAEQESQKALQAKLDEARARYDDADDVIFPANQAIQKADMPLVVKEVFAKSDVFIDLCYVVGSAPDELKKFIALAQTDPRAAIGKVFEYERRIKEELSKGRDDKGKFTSKEAPEVKKTGAPKPPSPVNGASSRAFDVSDDSLSNEEWMRQRNLQIAKRKT